jgi:CBS domain-containing protein
VSVADAMMTHPAVHRPSVTVGELRAFFDDDHVHMALLVDNGEIVGIVERADLVAAKSDGLAAREFAALNGRTIAPGATLADAIASMKGGGRRRLAVTTEGSALVGLLCLKASGRGFCSDQDVDARSHAQPTQG